MSDMINIQVKCHKEHGRYTYSMVIKNYQDDNLLIGTTDSMRIEGKTQIADDLDYISVGKKLPKSAKELLEYHGIIKPFMLDGELACKEISLIRWKRIKSKCIREAYKTYKIKSNGVIEITNNTRNTCSSNFIEKDSIYTKNEINLLNSNTDSIYSDTFDEIVNLLIESAGKYGKVCKDFIQYLHDKGLLKYMQFDEGSLYKVIATKYHGQGLVLNDCKSFNIIVQNLDYDHGFDKKLMLFVDKFDSFDKHGNAHVRISITDENIEIIKSMIDSLITLGKFNVVSFDELNQ